MKDPMYILRRLADSLIESDVFLFPGRQNEGRYELFLPMSVFSS